MVEPPIRIPIADVEIGEPEIDAVSRVLRSRWLTTGATCARFEAALSARCGVPHALAVASGTAALHLAYLALGIGPGDEVLLPTLSFVATANMARAVGATPVFVDCRGETDLNLDPADLAQRIGPRTRAIALVHYGGYPCAVDEARQLGARHGIPVVEDCAHAPGGRFRGQPLGSLGDVGCFSFFGNKNITTGEGGAVVTRNRRSTSSRSCFRLAPVAPRSWHTCGRLASRPVSTIHPPTCSRPTGAAPRRCRGPRPSLPASSPCRCTRR